MSQGSQTHAFTASMQQCWSEGMAMVLAGTEVLQAQGKALVERGLEITSASTTANLKCIEDLTGQMSAVTHQAEALLHEQVAVLQDLPNDPMGASQRLMANYVEGSRKSLELGTKALTSWAGLMNETWIRAGKLGQEAGQAYVACAAKLQEISQARAKA